jgi:hypothetical protein
MRDRMSHKEETEGAAKKTEEGVAKKRQKDSLGETEGRSCKKETN